MRKPGYMRSACLIILSIQLMVACTYGQPEYSGKKPETATTAKGKTINQLPLQTLNHQVYHLSALHKKLMAIVFLSPECPLCQNYSLVLNRLQTKYGRDLDIVGVFPGKSYSTADCRAFQTKYKIQFLLLTDSSKNLANVFGASITPEAFLLNRSGSILYHGAIDNWVITLGKQRNKTTENYLEDGISEDLSGVSVKKKEVKPIGCFINEF